MKPKKKETTSRPVRILQGDGGNEMEQQYETIRNLLLTTNEMTELKPLSTQEPTQPDKHGATWSNQTLEEITESIMSISKSRIARPFRHDVYRTLLGQFATCFARIVRRDWDGLVMELEKVKRSGASLKWRRALVESLLAEVCSSEFMRKLPDKSKILQPPLSKGKNPVMEIQLWRYQVPSLNIVASVTNAILDTGFTEFSVSQSDLVRECKIVGDYNGMLDILRRAKPWGNLDHGVSYLACFEQLITRQRYHAAREFFKTIPKNLQRDLNLVPFYVRGFLRANYLTEASKITLEISLMKPLPLFTFQCIIQAYLDQRNGPHKSVSPFLPEAMHNYGVVLKSGLTPSFEMYRDLIDQLAQTGNYLDISKLVMDLTNFGFSIDARIYTAIIQCHARNGDFESAQKVFDEMMAEGYLSKENVACARRVYLSLMHAYARSGQLDVGYGILDRMKNEGLVPTIREYNILIHQAARQGRQDVVERVSNEMHANGIRPTRDTYAGFLKVSVENADVSSAEEMFHRIDDTRGYILMARGYKNAGDAEKLSGLREKLRRKFGKSADREDIGIRTMQICLHGDRGEINEATKVFQEILDDGLLPERHSFTALLWAYVRAERFEEAIKIFDAMVNKSWTPDAATYNAIFHAHNLMRDWTETIRTFDDMIALGIQPDFVSLSQVLLACKQSRQPQKADEYIRDMPTLGIPLKPKLYNLWLETWIQNGNMEKIKQVMLEMRQANIQVSEVSKNSLQRLFQLKSVADHQGKKNSWEVTPSPPASPDEDLFAMEEEEEAEEQEEDDQIPSVRRKQEKENRNAGLKGSFDVQWDVLPTSTTSTTTPTSTKKKRNVQK